MLRTVACCILMLAALGQAKKGGKGGKISTSHIVNPDPDAANPDTSAEYNSGEEFTEGDMASKSGKANGEDRNAVSDVNRLWPHGEVPFQIHHTLSQHMLGKVKEAMADYHKYTCIKWIERKREPDYVLINSMKGGCYAYKGRVGGQQPLNLQDPGCDYKGTIVHEMLHTIGFAHEQSRGDRDKYIRINWHNIPKDKHSQFSKLKPEEENNMGFGYDFHSVMHYGKTGFSKDGRALTIETVKKSHQDDIGQRYGFSEQDIEEVKTLYKCKGKKSGVEGKNGCMDKDGLQCAQVMKQHGKDRACNSRGNIPEFCAMSCGKC